MDYAAFVRQLDRGEAPPIALLHGGDSQLLDDALDAATRGLFPDRALAAWGREVFDGREHGVDEIVRSAMTLPLGSGRRLVAVRRAQALAAKGADALIVYAASPNPATCLLLLADEPLRASRERRADVTSAPGAPSGPAGGGNRPHLPPPTRGDRGAPWLHGWLGGPLCVKLRRCWDAERRLKSSGEPRAEMAALVADLCAER